jgi:sterol desaturase/sphingolipid hydroxylase (fatty acid hydroxylase superfamily)
MTAVAQSTISLGGAARLFAAQTGPRVMAVYVSLALAGRLAVGGFSGRDLLAAAILIALEPFTEWVIHVFMLHFKPRRLLGRTVDLDVAKKHRLHHEDPTDLELVFVPLRMLFTGVPVVWALFLLLAPLEVATTLILTSTLMLSLYEWTHFLIHQPYRPKTRYYRAIWRAHRLHHYRNEHYWFGVTVNVGDYVLGTFPDKSAVPLSPTARTLLEPSTSAA